MVRALFDVLEQQWKRIILGLFLVLVAYYLVRGCIPGLGGGLLPASFVTDIERQYAECMDDLPYWPGDHRQPECGQVIVKTLGKGVVPSQSAADGVTKAVCYQLTYRNPRWTTAGGVVGHDIVWFGWTLSKVAVLRNGSWQAYPDESNQDEQRWAGFHCPGDYVLKSIQNAE